ncbi:MAG: hypothetical protein JWQ72_1871 [Polaromonas sp.]|nr:hypothetical protein [Polaromonas sp.]
MVSLLNRHLSDALRLALAGRTTNGGFGLEDVIRSGRANPESRVGVYAPDAQSYTLFSELFGPILQDLQPPPGPRAGLGGGLPAAAVVSTRIRVARNLAGHVFPAGMSRDQRLGVEEEIALACLSLVPHFPGSVRSVQALAGEQLEAMIASRQAFGPDDKYMAAAGIHDDWPVGRSVFCTPEGELSVWINEEDHLRVALVMPGACPDACYQTLQAVMACLSGQLDFCSDDQLGYLTSCPSNVGSGMRVSYWVDLQHGTAEAAFLEGLDASGLLQIRGGAGEHSARSDGMADVGFRQRVGLSETRMLEDMEALLTRE